MQFSIIIMLYMLVFLTVGAAGVLHGFGRRSQPAISAGMFAVMWDSERRFQSLHCAWRRVPASSLHRVTTRGTAAAGARSPQPLARVTAAEAKPTRVPAVLAGARSPLRARLGPVMQGEEEGVVVAE